ncbi:MAG TPA: hypothetical protein VEY07_07565, partial [Thermoplasmata archaeon]|nr:hypothetical protein [Thermoplasmata archaeon]
YFQRVSMKFAGPLTIQAGQIGFDEFLLTAVGGSGDLAYSANTTSLKNSHTISNCPALTDGLPHSLPTSGYIPCAPPPASYNVYRTSVNVWDALNGTDRASANWTFSVEPPESLQLFSQFKGYFFQGFQASNIFGVYAQIDNAPVTQLGGMIQGNGISFSHSNSSQLWWNSSSLDMGMFGPGAVLQVTASVSDWSEEANLTINYIATPDWLTQLASLAGVIQSSKTSGTGAFNLGYSLTQTVPIPIGKIFNSSLPIPLVSGNYSLIPSLQMAFTETSSGNVTLAGTFALSTPSISLGAFNLTISASVTVSGTFSLVKGGAGTETIDWLSASVVITVKGDFSGSFPIYGFSFNFLGAQVNVGFTLEVDIAPAIAVSLLMMPTQDSGSEVAQGFGMAVEQVIGAFTLPISVSLSFGIGIASVAIGGMISVALAFAVSPGPFYMSGLWVNGSIFVSAQVLFWSGQWDLVGPGSSYHWSPTFVRPHPTGGNLTPQLPYDNGSTAVWGAAPRYYNTSAYNGYVWSPAGTSGAAISDIYPTTQVSAAPGYDGAYLLYTNDSVTQPQSSGLGIAMARLSSATNSLDPRTSPVDPGFVIANPRVSALPDGSLYALWQALPMSESGASSPLGISSIGLHGARFYPANGTWGPVHVWTSSGFAESYAVDGSSAGGTGAVLLSGSLLPRDASPEWLVTLDLTTGTIVSNASVTGVSTIDSVRGSSGWATVRNLDGSFSVLALATGSPRSVPALDSISGSLVSATFVTGSPSAILLRYRGASASETVLEDLSSGTAIATFPGDPSVSDVRALYSAGSYYVVSASSAGLRGWQVTAGTVSNLSVPPTTGIDRFDLVQAGGSILLYALVTASGGSQPIRALTLVEIPAALPSVTAGTPSTPTSGSSAAPVNYLLYLAITAVAGVLVLAVVAVWSRRKPPAAPASTVPAGPAGEGMSRPPP